MAEQLNENLGEKLAKAVEHRAMADIGDENPRPHLKKYNALVKDIRDNHGDEAADAFAKHAGEAAYNLHGSSAAAENTGSQFFPYMSDDEKATYKKQFKNLGGSMDENYELEEDSAAMDSLKPNSKPADPTSKIGMMQSVLGAMNGMEKQDLTHWFAAAMAQFGPNKEYGVGDNSAKNRASVAMKPTSAMKEDIEAMFDGQDLSEEFKLTASTLFEAAVNARVITESARLEETYENALQENYAVFTEEVTNKLDSYLSYVTENWMKENEVAIESTLRNELMEEFIEGLRNLFSEHYISVPQEQTSVLEALADKVGLLESKLSEVIVENAELRGVLVNEAAKNVFAELSSDLALTQQEKFAALAEGIEFDGDVDTFAKKLSIIKENYFNNDTAPRASNILEESFEGEEVSNVGIDPHVNRYVQALSRQIKK